VGEALGLRDGLLVGKDAEGEWEGVELGALVDGDRDGVELGNWVVGRCVGEVVGAGESHASVII